MIATLPALWCNGIPPATPAAIGSVPLAMLVLFGLLCATVVLLLCAGRRAPRRVEPNRRRHLRVVSPPQRVAAPLATARAAR